MRASPYIHTRTQPRHMAFHHQSFGWCISILFLSRKDTSKTTFHIQNRKLIVEPCTGTAYRSIECALYILRIKSFQIAFRTWNESRICCLMHISLIQMCQMRLRTGMRSYAYWMQRKTKIRYKWTPNDMTIAIKHQFNESEWCRT